jgi:glycosyltransferase involved in cell wall biosynthesis
MIAACPFPAARGTPIRIQRIADELSSRGHDINVFTYHLGSSGTGTYRIHRIPRVPTYTREAPGPSYQKLFLLDPLLAIKLVRSLRASRYDLIHAHHVEGLLAALPSRWLFRVPLVFDVHTLLENELPYYPLGLPRRLLARVGRAMDQALPARSDHVIAVSDKIRAALAKSCAARGPEISVIPNGVEDEFFAAGTVRAADRGAVAPSLVFAGNLAAYQGIESLLRAFALARRTQPDLRLRILTDDSFDAYEPLANELRIRDGIGLDKVGLQELPRELAAADVAINPRSDCAGLPQKLLNYMASGCPIVSFAGSARHLVHERNCLIVEDRDESAMAQAILRLLDHPDFARRLGSAARACARAEFGWEQTASRIEQVYDAVLRTRRRSP